MRRNKLSKEELHAFPIKKFSGEIYLIDDFKNLNKAIDILKEQTVLGFDTETRPAFKKGVFNNVALIQLSTQNQAFLFRINKIGLPDALIDVLTDESIIKVGAAIRDDLKALKKINPFTPSSFIDLQNYVKYFGIESYSLQKMSAIVLGFRISKSQQLSNWETTELTKAQMVYAATDAWVSLEIYLKLKNNPVKNNPRH